MTIEEKEQVRVLIMKLRNLYQTELTKDDLRQLAATADALAVLATAISFRK